MQFSCAILFDSPRCCQDQIQQFNTKADACGAVGAKACLLGSAQTDKDVVDAALAGNYCPLASTKHNHSFFPTEPLTWSPFEPRCMCMSRTSL